MAFPLVPVLLAVVGVAAILKRTTHPYELKQGKKTVYRGITNDPERRAREHARSGKKFDSMNVGEATWRSSAKRDEAERLSSYRRSHGGKNPKYNRTDHG